MRDLYYVAEVDALVNNTFVKMNSDKTYCRALLLAGIRGALRAANEQQGMTVYIMPRIITEPTTSNSSFYRLSHHFADLFGLSNLGVHVRKMQATTILQPHLSISFSAQAVKLGWAPVGYIISAVRKYYNTDNYEPDVTAYTDTWNVKERFHEYLRVFNTFKKRWYLEESPNSAYEELPEFENRAFHSIFAHYNNELFNIKYNSLLDDTLQGEDILYHYYNEVILPEALYQLQ